MIASNRRVLLPSALALLGAAIGGGLAFLAEASKRQVGVSCAQAFIRGCESTVTEVPVSVPLVLVGAALGAFTLTAGALLVRALVQASR